MARAGKRWLVKQEPETYPFEQLEADGETEWDGVRNAQARNNLAEMSRGDLVLYYHSGKERAVVGVAEVVAEAHQDSTTDDTRWVAVDLAPVERLDRPVTLAAIKSEPSLSDIALVRQSRLSVMPLTAAAYRKILALGRDRG